MKASDLIELVSLAALWGGSFLFMRMGAPEFGPLALVELRTGIAALFLLPIVIIAGKMAFVRANAIRLVIVGAIGTALPFCLLSYATLFVSAGFASIINSTATIFTAIIAWIWVRERLNKAGIAGIALGFIGVFVLVFDRQGDSGLPLIPVLAGMGATLCYGIGANYSKQKLAHVPPLAIALGSQAGAALVLLPLSVLFWPEVNPGADAWMAVTALAVLCTGIAYILYFRLIAHVGVNRAMSVTYLIPFFGVVWGMLFLHEVLTLHMLSGGLLILLGVGLTTGVLTRRQRVH